MAHILLNVTLLNKSPTRQKILFSIPAGLSPALSSLNIAPRCFVAS